MRCKNCKQTLSRGQAICPACGADMSKAIRRARNRRRFLALFLLFVILTAALIGLNLYGRGLLNDFSLDTIRGLFRNEPRVEEPVPAEEPAPTEEPVLIEEPAPTEEPVPTGEPVPIEEPVPTEEPMPTEEPVPTEEPDPTGLVLPAGTADISPKAQFDALARGSLEPLFGRLCDDYEQARVRWAEAAARQELCGWTLQVSERGKRFLTDALEMDLSWLDSIALLYDLRNDGALAGTEAALSVNGVAAGSLRTVAELPDGETLFCVPELSESWFTAPEDVKLCTAAQMVAAARALPGGDALQALLTRCVELALKNITVIERSDSVLEAEGILQSCTVLDASIREEDAQRIASAVIAELRWDETTRDILCGAAAAGGDDPEALYEQFLSALDRADYRLSSLSFGGETLHLLAYADADGTLRGCSLRLGEKSFTAALPHDGERFGLELRLSSGSEVYELAGRGSVRGGVRDGDFVLRRDSESLARLSLQRSGEGLELAVVPREALLSALLPERLRSLASDLRLNLRTESDTLRIELLEQLYTLLTLSFEHSEGEETGLTAPAEALDFAQWRGELTAESFDGIFRNLKEAGLPAGLLMELRMQLEAGETPSASD